MPVDRPPTGEQLAGLLRGRFRGAVAADRRRRAEYSSDASNYRVVPAAVGFPQTVADIEVALETCRAYGVPLTMRGGGTSIAGNAVGSGLVLDTSRQLNRVLSVDPGTATAVVQPGAVLDDLQRAAAAYGLCFGPDPSTHGRCTIGGMIGNNACGPRALSAGRTVDQVLELDVLTGAGQRLRAGPGGAARLPGVAELVGRHLATIRTELGRFSRQGSGYPLEHLLPERGGDLGRALVGSEGTCAVVLAATVRLVPAPAGTALAVLGYPDLPTAADAVPALLAHRPRAVEGMDGRLVEVLRRRRGPAAVPALPRGAAWLLVETGGATAAEAAASARRLVADAAALDSTVLTDPAAAARLWRIREDGAGLAGRTLDDQPAWPGWEDAAVPPAALGGYLRDFGVLLESHGLDAIAYGHFGDGCVHARIDFPLADRPDRFRAFLTDAAALVVSYGGSLSGEHGDGRARSELLAAMYSADALAAFAEFREACDPAGVLNPGVVVGPRPVDADLRLPGVPAAAATGEAFSREVHRCVGVARCRMDATAAGGFMCPSYVVTRDEKDSTRGRARVLQELVNGSLIRDGWRSAEVHEALDLCVMCKACAAECPAGVDMAAYKTEVLHRSYHRRLRPRAHYSLGWLPRWAALGSTAPGIANAALRWAPTAALARRLGGIDPLRPLPPLAAEPLRRRLARRGLPARGDPVLLWVDTFTGYFTPEVGEAAVAVLQRAGFAVRLPGRRTCCGLPWASTGQLGGARRQLRVALAVIAPYLLSGTPVLGLEPSCTAFLRTEAVRLLPGDPLAARVAVAVRTLAELLAERAPHWAPPRLPGRRLVVQPHCHHHAVLGFAPDRALLDRTGAQVRQLAGCCGLAGNFGVERGHFDISARMAEHALLPAVRAAGPEAIVLADGYSCRTQLQHLAGRRAEHLAELLARSGALGGH